MTDEHVPSGPGRIAILALVGVVGGVMAGIFGVGGGLFMVPLLVWLARYDQRRAVATSLAAIVITAGVGGAGYALRGEVELMAGALVAAGGVAGSLIGTRLLARLPLGWLRWLFIVFMIAAAIKTALDPPARGGELSIEPWAIAGLLALGFAMGVAGGLFGIGGGIIAVPTFIAVFGMGDLLAKGTSLIAMIPLSIVGSVTNARNHLLRWQDALVVGLCAAIATIPGVAVAFAIDPRTSSIAFSVLVLVAASQLAVRAIRHPSPR